jgi:ankyrin repeat protein
MDSFTTGSTPIHVAAQQGNLKVIKKQVAKMKNAVDSKDKNGWTPLHEAARAGHEEV